jgi:hypothetical protein
MTIDTANTTNAPSDLVWGAENIGREIGRSAAQVYYLHRTGLLDGAVTKLSHKLFVGSRRELRRLLPGFQQD